MNPDQIKRTVQLAKSIKAAPIDLWGAEWWYWRYQQGDKSIWEAVEKSLSS